MVYNEKAGYCDYTCNRRLPVDVLRPPSDSENNSQHVTNASEPFGTRVVVVMFEQVLAFLSEIKQLLSGLYETSKEHRDITKITPASSAL